MTPLTLTLLTTLWPSEVAQQTRWGMNHSWEQADNSFRSGYSNDPNQVGGSDRKVFAKCRPHPEPERCTFS